MNIMGMTLLNLLLLPLPGGKTSICLSFSAVIL